MPGPSSITSITASGPSRCTRTQTVERAYPMAFPTRLATICADRSTSTWVRTGADVSTSTWSSTPCSSASGVNPAAACCDDLAEGGVDGVQYEVVGVERGQIEEVADEALESLRLIR